jgi:hypothetical protein
MPFLGRNAQNVETAVRIEFFLVLGLCEIVHRVIDYDARSEILFCQFCQGHYPDFLGTLYNVMIGGDVTFLRTMKPLIFL